MTAQRRARKTRTPTLASARRGPNLKPLTIPYDTYDCRTLAQPCPDCERTGDVCVRMNDGPYGSPHRKGDALPQPHYTRVNLARAVARGARA